MKVLVHGQNDEQVAQFVDMLNFPEGTEIETVTDYKMDIGADGKPCKRWDFNVANRLAKAQKEGTEIYSKGIFMERTESIGDLTVVNLEFDRRTGQPRLQTKYCMLAKIQDVPAFERLKATEDYQKAFGLQPAPATQAEDTAVTPEGDEAETVEQTVENEIPVF